MEASPSSSDEVQRLSQARSTCSEPFHLYTFIPLTPLITDLAAVMHRRRTADQKQQSGPSSVLMSLTYGRLPCNGIGAHTHGSVKADLYKSQAQILHLAPTPQAIATFL